MRKQIIFIVAIIASLMSSTMLSATDMPYSATRNHIIIALDESGTDWRSTEANVREGLKNFLFNNNGNPLLGEDDYISVVGVKADCSAKMWDDFVYVKTDKNQRLAYINDNSYVNEVLSDSRKWSDLAKTQRNYDSSYSLVSIAKPYILARLGAEMNKAWVERTFILLVTDHRYNGGDFYNELQYFLGSEPYMRKHIGLFDALELCYDVEKEFCIEYVDVCEWRPYNGGIYHNVELFEVCPNQDYLTLPAVIDFSPYVTAERRKGRKYEIQMDFSHSNEHFEVDNLSIYLCSDRGDEICLASVDNLNTYELSHTYRKKDKFSKLRLEATLRLKDGVYDATLLSPEIFPGLIHTLDIKQEKDAKILFGLARLPDCLWFPGIKNQYVAAIVTSFIILILAIAAFVIYIMKTRTYIPRKDELKIEFYD